MIEQIKLIATVIVIAILSGIVITIGTLATVELWKLYRRFFPAHEETAPSTDEEENDEDDIDPMPRLNAASISPFVTLAIGIAVSCFVGLLSGFISWLLLGNQLIFFAIVIAIVFGYACWWFGRIDINVAHKGIILILGKRFGEARFNAGKKCLLDEGEHWIFPFFKLMRVRIMDVRERSVKSEGTYLVSTERITPKTRPGGKKKPGGISFFVSSTVQFRVHNPFVLLNAVESVVITDLVDLMKAAILKMAAESTPTEFPHIKTQLTDRIIARARQVAGSTTLPDPSEDGFIWVQIRRWGITLLNANVNKIEHTREETLELYEMIFKEQLEQDAEKIQKDTLVLTARALHEEFKPALSYQEALLIAQRISGQLTAQEFVFTGSTDAIMAAAALHSRNNPATPPKP